MPTYTVHAPPMREGRAADPQRFAFVRDGFHFWAFLLAPAWLLFRRQWLVFFCYLVLAAALEGGFYLLRSPESARLAIDLLVNILIGLEAGTLQRWTYARRKWATVGIVNADNRESAERQFFRQWADAPAVTAGETQAPSPVEAASLAKENDIIGLFPQPGGRL